MAFPSTLHLYRSSYQRDIIFQDRILKRTFVLAFIQHGIRMPTHYEYVYIIKEIDEEEWELTVQGLKCYNVLSKN